MSAEAFIQTMKGLILKEISPLLPAWRWGAVSNLSPLTVTLDAGQGVLQGIGTNVAGLKSGDRVQVLTWRGRSRVVGIDGGSPFPEVPPKDAGIAGVSGLTQNNVSSVYVALPAGRYTNPAVVVTPQTNMPGSVFASHSDVTSNGFTIYARRPDSIPTQDVHWHVSERTLP